MNFRVTYSCDMNFEFHGFGMALILVIATYTDPILLILATKQLVLHSWHFCKFNAPISSLIRRRRMFDDEGMRKAELTGKFEPVKVIGYRTGEIELNDPHISR